MTIATPTRAGRIDDVGYNRFEEEKYGNFYAADIASIAATATYSTASDEGYFPGSEEIWISCKATGGNASASGNVTFNFVVKGDATQSYPTTASFSVVLTLSGTSAVVKDAIVSFPGKLIKVLSIVNGDASYTATLVNAAYFAKQ